MSEYGNMSVTNGTNETDPDPGWRYIVEGIEMCYSLILIVLGTIGNCISVLAFFTTKLRKLSSSFYLAALAISDTGFLVALFISWLNSFGVPLFNVSGLCEMNLYLTYVCSFLSAWLVVAFTVERFIAVRYPLRRPSMCTVARAKVVLASLTLLALILNVPNFWLTQIEIRDNKPICSLNPKFTVLATVINHVDFVVTFILPFFVIATLNAWISLMVWQLARIRRVLTLTGPRERNIHCRRLHQPHCAAIPQQSLRSSASQTKVTKMLLVVSTVFLCLNLPSYVLRVRVYVQGSESKSQEENLPILQHVAHVLFITNFGINFVLYCVSGQNFRRAFCSLCCSCCPCSRQRADSTQLTVVSEYTRSTGSIAHRRTVTLNGFQVPWKEAHELLPLTK
ncbi:thyrotropin-releasing hormone receptor [Cryptotermes secundus]|uniref:thyrotropin-releasing hormone receptor n=1 Tax=Cryptotermes secundus TaxID=105785 RepID=UPI001454B8B5|nr:thyrotropin-releasing hormone receptor [Cryptotermes secundus]